MEYVFQVDTHGKKYSAKKRVGIGIENFGIGIELELINLKWNWNWPNGIEWNWNWQNGIDPMSDDCAVFEHHLTHTNKETAI